MKKFLAAFLTICLMISIFSPMSVLAEDEEIINDENTQTIDEASEYVPSVDDAIVLEDGNVSVSGILPEDTVLSVTSLDELKYAPEEEQPIVFAPLFAAKPVLMSAPMALSTSNVETDTDTEPVIEEVDDQNDDFLAVYDIKLTQNGDTIQPGSDNPVTVRIQGVQIPEGSDIVVTHILDDYDAIINGLENGTVWRITDGILVERFASYAATVDPEESGQCVYAEFLSTEDGSVSINEDGSIEFEARSFSVYVIGEVKRLIVRFHQANSEAYTDVYVKQGDDLSKVLYDPGVGTLQPGQLFKGWSVDDTYNGVTYPGNNYTEDNCPSMNTETLREYIATKLPPSADSTVLEVWPVVIKAFQIQYLDETDAVIETLVVLRQDQESMDYTIDMGYVPMHQDSAFKGWYIDGPSQANVTAARNGSVQYEAPFEGPYENGTVITIKGNIVLKVNVPSGHWLIFNENGKGAKYTSPQFLESAQVSVEPDPPTRFGYRFMGWYEAESVDSEGNPVLKTDPFVFGTTIDRQITVYAKWEPNGTATYTVLIWKQKTIGDGYDFAESVSLTGSVGSNASNVIRTSGEGDNRYAIVNNVPKRYTGFHLNEYDAQASIVPEGSTVVNVYYDRNIVTLTFRIRNNGSIDYEATLDTTGELYGKVNGEYVPIYTTDGGTAWWYDTADGYLPTEDLSAPLYGQVGGEYILLSYEEGFGWYYTSDSAYAQNAFGDIVYGLVNGEYIELEKDSSGKYWYLPDNPTEFEYVPTTANYNQQPIQYILLDGEYVQIYWHNGWGDNYWFYTEYVPDNTDGAARYAYVNGQYILLERRYVGIPFLGGHWEYYLNNQLYTGQRYSLEEKEISNNTPRFIRVPKPVEYTGDLYTHTIPYPGPYFKRNSSPYQGERFKPASGSGGWRTVHVLQGRYGSTLAENGLEWPTERWWYDNYSSQGNNYTGSGTRTTFLDAFILSNGASSHTYYGFTGNGNRAVYFYKETADGLDYELANTVETTGGTFYISDKYNGFHAVSYRLGNSGGWTDLGDKDSSGYYASVATGNNNLYIHYDRDKFNILFRDGVYVDGGGTELTAYTGQGVFKEQTGILFGSDISSYNKGGANYYVPQSYDGFLFEGWYIDSACRQPFTFDAMPQGLTVYAKWRQIQYRVFLHPMVTEQEDSSLSFGNQGMSFRVDWGASINSIHGVRNEYELVGWYMDPQFTRPFNFDAYVLNDNTVTTPYDKTEDTELESPYATVTPGKEGVNSDANNNRFWITRKLDLYAKWRSKLIGANGITVVYESGTGGTIDGGGTTYTDEFVYKDLSTAYAIRAARATDSENEEFKYWDIQKYVDGEFVSSGDRVYPGDTYIVRKAYTQQIENEGSTAEEPSYTYLLKIVAKYGPYEEPSETAVRFDPNGGAFTDPSITDPTGYIQTTYIENKDIVTIPGDPEMTNYRFLGWAGSANATSPDITLEDIQASHAGTKNYAADNLDGLGWSIHDDTLDRDINVLYAVWEEDTVDITYKVVGPEGCGTVKLNNEGASAATSVVEEDVKVISGPAVGATASASGSDYVFVGWYLDEACTQPAGEGYQNASYVPSKNAQGVYEEKTYYAKFDYNVTSLTITKSGMTDNERAIFIVTDSQNNIVAEVTLSGDSSKTDCTVKVKGLTVGETYTVTEKGDWSWRYTESSSGVITNTLSADETLNVFSFTNTPSNNKWIDSNDDQQNTYNQTQ